MIKEYLLNEQRSGQTVVRMYAHNDRAISVVHDDTNISLIPYKRTGPRIYNIDLDAQGDMDDITGMSTLEIEEKILAYLEYVPDPVRES